MSLMATTPGRGRRLRLLCVEDVPEDAELCVLALQDAGYSVEAEVFAEHAAFEERVRRGGFDLVLADYGLRGWTGMDALHDLRAAGCDAPVIMVTGSMGDETAVECLKQGACDYVLKTRLVKLPFAVEHALHTRQLERERRAAEEALRQREAQFRSLIEHGHDLILLMASDGTIVYASPSAERLLGYRPEEIMGNVGLRYIHPEDRARAREKLVEVQRYPGEMFTVQFRIRHKEGSYRVLEAIGTNLLHDPAVAAIVINQRDITERNAFEEELRCSERKYRELFELANDAILIFEPEHEMILEANARACELYAIPHSQLVGMSLKRLTQDVERGESQIAELLCRGSSSNFETVHHRADGTAITILANSKVIEYAGRTAILTVNHDISELKRAQDELRRAHDELEKRVEERTAELAAVNTELRRARDEWQATFDCMSDAITVHDTSFNILRWNRTFTDMFPGADIGSQKCYRLVHETDAPPEYCPMARSLASGRSETSEFFEPHLGRFMSARTDLVRDAEGRVERIVHGISDISERKETERMKNDFVSCVSHELRTPLASLRGFAELMLQREYPAEKRRHFLEIIQKESRRLGDLVNDVLDLQRIEAGRAVLQFAPLSLSEVVSETVELFSTPGGAHRIVDQAPAGFPAVVADLGAVRQILHNLVSNAVKYSPDGGEIGIGARKEGGRALLWVSDQGMGIRAELLPHIFSRFYRAPETAARRIGGTGLGLAVVKGLVEAHQGQVWVESEPGKGSVFYFTLALAECTAAPEAG